VQPHGLPTGGGAASARLIVPGPGTVALTGAVLTSLTLAAAAAIPAKMSR